MFETSTTALCGFTWYAIHNFNVNKPNTVERQTKLASQLCIVNTFELMRRNRWLPAKTCMFQKIAKSGIPERKENPARIGQAFRKKKKFATFGEFQRFVLCR